MIESDAGMATPLAVRRALFNRPALLKILFLSTLAATLVGLPGCAKRARLKEANAHFERRQYDQAAPLYEEFYGRHKTHQRIPEVLFRLFVTYAVPESSVFSLDRARKWLEESKKYPPNPYRAVSERILEWLIEKDELDRKATNSETRRQALAREAEALQQDRAKWRERVKEKDRQLKQLNELLEELGKIPLKKPRPPSP